MEFAHVPQQNGAFQKSFALQSGVHFIPEIRSFCLALPLRLLLLLLLYFLRPLALEQILIG